MSGVILIQNLAYNTVLELITPEAINTKYLTKALTNKKFIRKQANCRSQVQISSTALLSCLSLLNRDKIDWCNPWQAPLGNNKNTKSSGGKGDSINLQLGNFAKKMGEKISEKTIDRELADGMPKNSCYFSH